MLDGEVVIDYEPVWVIYTDGIKRLGICLFLARPVPPYL